MSGNRFDIPTCAVADIFCVANRPCIRSANVRASQLRKYGVFGRNTFVRNATLSTLAGAAIRRVIWLRGESSRRPSYSAASSFAADDDSRSSSALLVSTIECIHSTQCSKWRSSSSVSFSSLRRNALSFDVSMCGNIVKTFGTFPVIQHTWVGLTLSQTWATVLRCEWFQSNGGPHGAPTDRYSKGHSWKELLVLFQEQIAWIGAWRQGRIASL